MSPRPISTSEWPDDSSLSPSPLCEASPPVMIAVMGATGSGKSSFINLTSGSSLRVGKELESCTYEVQLADEFTLDGRKIILIDTPGFDDTSKSDTDILRMIAAFLATTYERGCKLSGVIYVHRISDKRFTGAARQNFDMFRQLCGDETLKNVVLVTNMWDEVSPEDGQDRENQLSNRFFKPVLDKGARLARHHNTTESAHNIIRMIIENHPIALQIQRELVDEQRDIVDTTAGEVLNHEINELIRQHQVKLKEVQEEMASVLSEKDEEIHELEEEKEKMQKDIERMKKNSDEMASKYAEEKQRMEAKVKKMMKEMKSMRELAGNPVKIPIYLASDDKNEVGYATQYRSTCNVSAVRRELIGEANEGSSSYTYVEVVVGEGPEGKFLEDLGARCLGKMGDVSRLVWWTPADMDRKANEIVGDTAKLGLVYSQVTNGVFSAMTSLVGYHIYFGHLLYARSTRDQQLKEKREKYVDPNL